MIKAPIGLQELRRRIYRKAKSEPMHRFWGLFVHVTKLETLHEAYCVAKRNGGAAGIDGQTFEAIEQAGRWRFLAELQRELLSGSYQPQANRRVDIPKGNGQFRTLQIPMGHAYCISFLRRLGIAVAAATSMNSMYQLTQYSGLGLTNQVSACKKTSSKVAEHFQWFGFFYFNKNSIPLASYHLLNSTPPISLVLSISLKN